ncbi:hypothetical protein LOSG293_011530 [Secundilactobacillus oryzae JCM 18671]|uniref:SAM-dependent methyltransferase n=1 Tax=Secundilactobacillus oryzae JCM 18671 TaxID=1291743 RepID=A0A081BG84_9LACO|nr:class I SAM-dependent methyltransferase [Secundilactobacillus oryzae]GAK47052.1 hypothetical protein LOSG293_011530 [Secundilactobacillus oryzae JCM 18671]
MQLESSLAFSHQLLKAAVQPGDTVIDGTAGNGHDTALLAELVGQSGHVLAFDIQEAALSQTKTRLDNAGLASQVQLIHDSHANLAAYLPENQSISAAIFNLGYLPGGDKQITTHAESTLQALQQMLAHLSAGGVVIAVLYYGHPGGKAEKDAVIHFASTLDQKQFQVLSYQFINQIHEPPILLAIQKR